MPIKGKILTASQMEVYQRTGVIPDDAPVASYDDNGVSLDGKTPNLDMKAAAVKAIAEGRKVAVVDGDASPPAANPLVNGIDVISIVNRATRLADASIMPHDEEMLKRETMSMIEAVGSLRPEQQGEGMTIILKTLRRAFEHGYGSAATDFLVVDVSWEDLVKAMRAVAYTECTPCIGKDCAHKAGRAWIPARMIEPSCKRLDANVAAITFAVYDLDDPTPAQMSTLARALEGQAYLCHQTHRGNGYRLIMPLTKEVPAKLWRDVWAKIGARFQIPLDITCCNESRLYYCPTRPLGSGFQVFDGLGKPLDWEALDPIFVGGAATASANFKQALASDLKPTFDPTDAKNLREGALDLEELRRSLAAMRKPESRDILDRILSGRSLAEVGSRDTALNQACSLMATTPLGKPYPADSVLALMYGSINAMDVEPEGVQHWLDLAREKYLRAVARRLERDAGSDADRAALMRVLGQGPEVAGSDDWRKRLLWGPLDKDGNPSGLRQTGSNVEVILANAPEFKGHLRFNAMTRDIEVSGGPLQGVPMASLDVALKNWLAHSEFRLFISSFDVREQVLAVARQQEYDPLRDWLEGLKWDGSDRVSDFFANYLSAEGSTRYLQAISRCFLISCIARASAPGCEVHTAPILVGEQGCGKSRSLKALGQPFFTDSKINFADKDSQLLIAGHWIVELAELAGWKAIDNETVKAFISRSEDKFRPPYGRAPEAFKRRCVFVGTTNEVEMLTDQTGNRRWWPVKVGKINVERIAKDRDQIFAQALAMFRAGTPWHLDTEESAVAALHAERFTAPANARSEQIIAWFAARPREGRPLELTSHDALSTIFAISSAQMNKALEMECGRAMRQVGFERTRKRIGGTLTWIYVTPAAILAMPHNARPSALELVPKTGDQK